MMWGCMDDVMVSFMMPCVLSREAMFLGTYLEMIGEKNSRRGQSLTEYALLIVPIAVVVIVVVTLLGSSVTNVFCTVTESFTIVEGEPCYETLSQVGDGPVVLRAKYRDTKDGIFLRARTENCIGDLIVVDYGTMDQGGDSNNYSISIVTDTPLETAIVGSDACGWTTVTLD
jgi:Flp pilus assembly pilin Flp